MCYAIPGKVSAIEDNIVTVDYFGEKKRAYNEFDNLKIGDYIYAQGGFVIKTIPPEEANSILAVWRETFFELQEHDLRLSRIDIEKSGVEKRLTLILDKAIEERPLRKDDFLYLLNLRDSDSKNLLYKTANFLRQKYLDNSCCVHGIIELSNYCARNCYYCGISVHNSKIPRYRMDKTEILSTVESAVEKYGFKALVLQSGEDPAFDTDFFCDIIREIKSRHAVLIFISFGDRKSTRLNSSHLYSSRMPSSA